VARDQGILIGLDKNTGELKTIDRVVSGKACNCVCPECRSQLVARKGRQKAHHYAHASLPDNLRNCQETALHLSAKIIAAHVVQFLSLPGRSFGVKSTSKIITPSGDRSCRYRTVTIEAEEPERLSGRVEPLVPEISPYRPDARVDTTSGSFYVEIRVTHPVPPEKQQAMDRANIPVVELDFSKVSRAGLTIEEMEVLVASAAPRSWLSFGCDELSIPAVSKLNAEVEAEDSRLHQLMMEQLRVDLRPALAEQVRIKSLHLKLGDHAIPVSGFLSLSNIQFKSGFTLADLPGVPNALVVSVDESWLVNRLFAWHQSEKGRPLTVISLSALGSHLATVYSSETDFLKRLLCHMHKNDLNIPAPILRAEVINRKFPMELETPITKEFLFNMGDRVYASSSISGYAAHALVKYRFYDVAIGFEDGNRRAVVSEDIAKQLSHKRPNGGIRETLIHNIQMGQPCLVRFVPSIDEKLKGDLFDWLVVYRGEIFLNVPDLGRERVYCNRGDFWKKGGLLIYPDPMRRGDFHLEASRDFLGKL